MKNIIPSYVKGEVLVKDDIVFGVFLKNYKEIKILTLDPENCIDPDDWIYEKGEFRFRPSWDNFIKIIEKQFGQKYFSKTNKRTYLLDKLYELGYAIPPYPDNNLYLLSRPTEKQIKEVDPLIFKRSR